MADLLDFDPLFSFDMDSSFWVCENSTTRHICNNKALFTDKLEPSMFQVCSATGMLVPNLMDAVIL
jgi:hypothetical protein